MILPVRVLGKCGGFTSDIVDGLRWAAGLSVSGVPVNANPARVANLSLGGSGSCDSTWQNGINAVTAAGMVVVVAAGNSSSNASNFNPASCNGVITVAATNRSGSKAWYSNYGATVEISAPGGETSTSANGILSTLNTGTTIPAADSYVYYQGTSMAAPHVTGVVSLMLSLNPSLTPAQVLTILQSTARPFPGGSTCNTSLCGSGMLDAAAAVNAVPLPMAITNFLPDHGSVGTSVMISGTGFTDVSAVRFNGTSASFAVLNDTTIQADRALRCNHRTNQHDRPGRHGHKRRLFLRRAHLSGLSAGAAKVLIRIRCPGWFSPGVNKSPAMENAGDFCYVAIITPAHPENYA